MMLNFEEDQDSLNIVESVMMIVMNYSYDDEESNRRDYLKKESGCIEKTV